MKKMTDSKWTFILFLLFMYGLMTVGVANATMVTVPNTLAATEGNGGNIFPFNLGFTTNISSMRYQQVYDASEFSSLAPGGEFITEILFRPDNTFGDSFSTTITNIQINLSTTSLGPDGLSLTFADNVGVFDDTVVFGPGPLSLSSSDVGGPPRDFDISIMLTTPFFYDPSLGNLLLDVSNFSGETTTAFDTSNDFGDGISRVLTFTSSDVNSANAEISDTAGLVTKFNTTASIPEPSTMLLLGSGLLGLAAFRRKFRK